ncbi:MAG: hypothetical protein IGBAC_0603 [Ignavibacteriae bacterium]|nr:MAG: hypothetical protein IGBAC_0603 [Ignavibacteriota bacterium]
MTIILLITKTPVSVIKKITKIILKTEGRFFKTGLFFLSKSEE